MLTEQAAQALACRRASAEADHVFVRTADVRYFGQAFEVRSAYRTAGTAATLAAVADRPSTPSTGCSTATTSPATSQQVELVNLRVSGVGPIKRPRSCAPTPQTGAAVAGPRSAVCFDAEGYVETPVFGAPTCPPGRSSPAR